MADRDPENDSGRDENSDVDKGNDAFASAFADFAAGKTPEGGDPAPKDGEEGGEGGDKAGQDGAEREDNSSPSKGDEKDPPADAPGDKPAAGEEAPDLWAKATPEQIAERDRLRAELETARKSDEGSRRRASGLQRQLNALQATTAAQPPQDAKGGKDGEEPSDAWKALDEKIKQIEEDYPEIAGVIVPLLKAQRDELADLKSRVTPVIVADQAEAAAEQVATLEAKHQDWRNFGVSDSPEYTKYLAAQPEEVRRENENFRNWLGDQPGSIQKLAQSWDASEVAVALTLYKTERAEAIKTGGDEAPGKKEADATGAKRQRQLDGGSDVRSRAGSAASGAPDDFTGAFEHFSQKRQASGK